MKLVVGWDPNDPRQVALVWGRTLARSLHAQMELLSVIPPMPEAPLALQGRTRIEELESERKTERLALMRSRVSEVIGDEPPPEMLVRTGQPSQELARRAEELEDAVVLVGTGSRRWFEALLGTTADRLLRLASDPVLVVRGPIPEGVRGVLAALDLSLQSEAVAARAAEWASGLGASLTLFHVPRREWSQAFLEGEVSHRDPQAMEDVERARSRARAALQEFSETLVEAYPGLDVRRELGEENTGAADGVLARLGSGGVDLVVTGTHGVGFFDRMILGSVAESVIQRAPCPVLVVPARASLAREA